MEVKTKNDLAPLGEASIAKMIEDLQKEGCLDRHLPGGGYIHMSDQLPYIVIHRQQKEKRDKATVRFVLSEASFLIIGDKDFKGYQRLIYSLSDAMATKFKTFLLLELFAGDENSNRFAIQGPSDKLPTTLKVLQTELDNLRRKFEVLSLEPTEVSNTIRRHPIDQLPLLELNELKSTGSLLLGLEIPPVYRNKEGEEYPVFFRSFKDDLILAIHKAVYEFIRVQTSSGVQSYSALGRKSLKGKVYEIDKKLSDIERSYQFLWLISPANIRDVKNTFFNSNYEKVLNYHYRLLPIDPDLLKRELYNLKMEDIDDPAISYLFREKREELDQQITMLRERGNPKFFYNGILLYKGVDPMLHAEAEKVLNEVPETHNENVEELIDAREFAALARKEFEYFQKQDETFSSKIHIREDVNILMVSQGELYIPEDYKMNKKETKALIQHEVGTHVLTYHNGKQQPLRQLSVGLADYDALQEGLAVMAEYFVDGLTANRLRTLAGRVVAGKALFDGAGFLEIFKLLKDNHGFSAERSFSITSRIMQGGGFLKDIIYLKGLVHLREYLQNGGEFEPLLAGKIGLKHGEIIRELTERKILKPAVLRPSYLLTEDVPKKLKLIREGLPLSQMITQ